MLYIVSTPIGNLADITFRAVEVLKSVDVIICEDTRTSKKLLDAYDVQKKLMSYHAHSSQSRDEEIIRMLADGVNIAMISDAGTPGISDPGYRIIRAARENGVKVVPVPGASAFLTALQGSGFPTSEFVYLGFLPMKKGRSTLLKELVTESRTLVFYESPHRIAKAMQDLVNYFGEDRKVCIAREITKMFEEYIIGTTKELAEITSKKKLKGEIVVIVAPEWF